jgi:hypothetical protein
MPLVISHKWSSNLRPLEVASLSSADNRSGAFVPCQLNPVPKTGVTEVASEVFCLSRQRPWLSAHGYLLPTCPCRNNLCRPYLSRMRTYRLDFAFLYLLQSESWIGFTVRHYPHQNNRHLGLDVGSIESRRADRLLRSFKTFASAL